MQGMGGGPTHPLSSIEVAMYQLCQRCGTQNSDTDSFCRQCGTALLSKQSAYTPYQSSLSKTETAEDETAYLPPQWPNDPQPVQPVQLEAVGYRCPNCASQHAPLTKKRISPSGWTVFFVLLFLCPPFFWIGLLMKEEYAVCPMCLDNVS